MPEIWGKLGGFVSNAAIVATHSNLDHLILMYKYTNKTLPQWQCLNLLQLVLPWLLLLRQWQMSITMPRSLDALLWTVCCQLLNMYSDICLVCLIKIKCKRHLAMHSDEIITEHTFILAEMCLWPLSNLGAFKSSIWTKQLGLLQWLGCCWVKQSFCWLLADGICLICHLA